MRAVKLNNKSVKNKEPFKGLFTQGMVCHETYKDQDGKWVSPDEIQKEKDGITTHLLKKTKIVVGPSEAMSKSKKNIIDPESMIKIYGADSVRWFILSDSPPDKDVQWSNQGVRASYKFLQKIWGLNNSILERSERKSSKLLEEELKSDFNDYLIQITKMIENFQLNVVIANVYEIYNLIFKKLNKDVSNKCLLKILEDFMKILIPFTPHIASECLEKLNIKNINLDRWPEIDKNLIGKKKIKVAVQINGKTKEIIEVPKDLQEKELVEESKMNDKVSKSLTNKKIIRVIFVKNKIINYLIK